MTYIGAQLRGLVAERARNRCEYCQSQKSVMGMPFEIEHILPLSAGGDSREGNLCLACPRCNRHKGTQVTGLDEETGEIVTLFDPRRDRWGDHFSWSGSGERLLAQTATARATIEALQMNNAFAVRARRLWALAGWHPPEP